MYLYFEGHLDLEHNVKVRIKNSKKDRMRTTKRTTKRPTCSKKVKMGTSTIIARKSTRGLAREQEEGQHGTTKGNQGGK
jgi:hypothetical protein